MPWASTRNATAEDVNPAADRRRLAREAMPRLERALEHDALGNSLLDPELDLVALAHIGQQTDHRHAANTELLRNIALRHLLDVIHPGHTQPHALVALIGIGARRHLRHIVGRS